MTPSSQSSTRHLLNLFRGAETWLELNREYINTINVYPVPDGDTGTNMLLTLRAYLEDAELYADGPVGPCMQALAHKALLGARGNSGVILSQMLRGMAESLNSDHHIDGTSLRDAFEAGASTAYEAVSEPIEGTMLTVMRDAASAAGELSNPPIHEVLNNVVEEAQASVDRTPSLLPQLAEAGVVDAGGLGLSIILEGMRFAHLEEEFPDPSPTPANNVDMSGVQHEGHGYCTEFVVIGQSLDRNRLENVLKDTGAESILVVGDSEALRVHAHVDDPGVALSAGADAGSLDDVKVEHMQAQHDRWITDHQTNNTTAPNDLGLVAIAQGSGIASALRELGATRIVDGGPTANPSTRELIDAARETSTAHVLLLSNDPNVIMTAEAAAAEDPELISVVPARSTAASLAAAVAFDRNGDPKAIAARMIEASEGCRSIEVTHSVRDTVVNNVAIGKGDAIVLLDGSLVDSGQTLEDALLKGLALTAESAELITIYLGSDAPTNAAESLTSLIASTYNHLEIDVINGGQPHYPYLLGVE